MDIQTLPTDLPCSTGVRRRIERSRPAVRAASGFAGVLKEALVRRWGDKLERDQRQRDLCAKTGGPEVGGPEVGVAELFQRVGHDIEEKSKALMAADAALKEARQHRRAWCRRRDRAAKGLYKELSAFRKAARGLLGKEGMPDLLGETPRDPYTLVFLTDLDTSWANDVKNPQEQPIDGVTVPWAELARRMKPTRDETHTAIHAVYYAKAGVDAALEARENALEAFDKTYNRGSRLLECLLVYLGLPTLAAAVRPHLKVAGRVGRPSKKVPVDEYPDLVEQVRAAGLLPAEPKTCDETDTGGLRKRWSRMRRYLRFRSTETTTLADSARADSSSKSSASSRPGSPTAVIENVQRWPARALDWWRRRQDAA